MATRTSSEVVALLLLGSMVPTLICPPLTRLHLLGRPLVPGDRASQASLGPSLGDHRAGKVDGAKD